MINLFKKIKERNYRKISFIGINIYEKFNDGDFITTKFFKGFIKTKKDTYLRIKRVYLCGVIIYESQISYFLFKKLKKDIEYLKIKQNMNLAIANHHSKIFPQFKNINRNKTVAIVATGKTMSYYKQNDNIVNIGVNAACLREDIDFSYWFAIDYSATKNLMDFLKLKKYYKFFGQCSSSLTDHCFRKIKNDEFEYYFFPDSLIDDMPNSFKFYIDHPSLEINRDIETQAMPDLSSCVFSALRFALYTGTKKIYLVGCDASLNGYFDKNYKQIESWSPENVLRGWYIYKEFLDIFYPDVEIISINPVGLKGIFKDIYTKNYIENNIELKSEFGENIIYLEDIEDV